MLKSGLFGVRLVKHTSSIANIFSFEVPTPNGQRSAVHQTFAVQKNAICCTSATRTREHFSHFHMLHSAFAYRCERSFRTKYTCPDFASLIISLHCFVFYSVDCDLCCLLQLLMSLVERMSILLVKFATSLIGVIEGVSTVFSSNKIGSSTLSCGTLVLAALSFSLAIPFTTWKLCSFRYGVIS